NSRRPPNRGLWCIPWFAGKRVAIPENVRRTSDSQRQAFFTGAKSGFDMFTFRDVEDGTGHTEWVAGRVPMDVSASIDKPDFAVRTDDTIFHIVGTSSELRVVEGGYNRGTIVRMQRGQELVICDRDGPWFVAEDAE